jgi:hypothetical protein
VIDLRLRSKIGEQELKEKEGKILTDSDFNLLLTGAAFVRKPDGKPLCVYLPGVVTDLLTEEVYTILHKLRTARTDNRGLASGTLRAVRGNQNRARSKLVSSAIIGSADPGGVFRYCRQTAWTGKNLPQWLALQPLLQAVAGHLQEHVPDRYENQMEEVRASKPEWIVPGTPFSTITVNNTYPTGVHTDKGDLDKGFSTIACLRRGEYTGGTLCFPEYRVGVNMKHGDLLLMDAHEWHGNTAITCPCGRTLGRNCETCGAERISVVSYYRTAIVNCGTMEEELERAVQDREKRATTSH